MGHIRLGRLPRNRAWAAVVESLRDSKASSASIAAEVLHSSFNALSAAKTEPGCASALQTLSEFVLAARHPLAFESALDRHAIPAASRDEGVALLAALIASSSKTQGGARTILTDFAQKATADLLLGRIRERADSLFGVSPDSVREVLATYATDTGFRSLTQEWFSRFVGRTIQSVIDRELGNAIGRGRVWSAEDALTLHAEVMAYSRERTVVLSEFAPAWLSKTLWQDGRLTAPAFRKFFSYALEKLRRAVDRDRGVA